jgi:TPR repeat protein
MKRFLSVLTVLLSLASVPAIAQSANKAFNDGVAAFQSRDYATALKLWMPLAEKDDAEAQRNIGIMFQQGLGVPQSDAEAAKWYRRAAENGHARAQQNLGVMYEEGAGGIANLPRPATSSPRSTSALCVKTVFPACR